MKRIIELSIKGVGLALALFAVFGLVADVANQGVFTLKNYNYTKMVIASLGTSVLLWVVFMLRDRRTAERINERIRELEDEDEVHVTKEA